VEFAKLMAGVTETAEMVRTQGPVGVDVTIDLPAVVLEKPIAVNPPPHAPYDWSDGSVDEYVASPKGQYDDMDEDVSCM
jgi:hypothetical protein